MSTIPSTSKRLSVPYTVVGGGRSGRARRFPTPLTLLLLNRGGRFFKHAFFEELTRLGAEEIISIEGPTASYEIENLSRDFPTIKFMVLHEPTSRGEQINMGVEEAKGELVFVIWNDMKLSSSSISARIVERIRESDCLCTVPLVQNARLETVPTIMAPAFYNKLLKVLALQPSSDGIMSLFPFDYCGIYNKERFILVGGYDSSLATPYWQKMDFGFRSYMWGEKIHCSTALHVSYSGELPSEDSTPDEGYKMFFLKNLSVRFTGDSGILPRSRFFPYILRTGGAMSALKAFRRARAWVETNRFRFKQDARSVTDLWEVPEL